MPVDQSGARRAALAFSRLLWTVVLAAHGLGSATAIANWPTLHRDNQRSGYTDERLCGPLERKWYRSFVEQRIGARVEPIVAEGRCFIGTYAGDLYALDIIDGVTVWRIDASGPIGHSPCYWRGRVFVCTDEGFCRGRLLCVEARSGRLLWQYQAGAGIWNSPVCDGRTVYVGDRAGKFHAVDATTGQVAWTYQTGYMILKPASLSADGEQIIVGSEDMHVYCLSPQGDLVWKSKKLPGLSLRDQAPTIWGDKVVVRTNPAWGFHQSLYAGRALLREIQKSLPWDPAADAVVVETENMFFLRRTDRREEAEHTGVKRFLRQHPYLQTWHTLNLRDGRQPWITSVLFSSGMHNPPSPPTFCPNSGALYTIMPTAIGVYCSGVSQTGIGIGRIDPDTGYVTNVVHGHGDREPGYFAGMPMITDETSTLGLMGDFLAVTHMGAVGGVDLITRRIGKLHGIRDTYGGLFGPGAVPGSWEGSKRLAEKGYVQNATNEWHGPDRSMVAISDQRAFWVVGGCVVCFGGPDVPPTNSGGGEPPPPWKWSRMPRLDGGNVTAAFGNYDADVSKRTITAEQITPYLEPPQTPAVGDHPAYRAVAERLEAAVEELIAGHPWAPWVIELGISQEEIFFGNPAETMRALAQAMPYLSPQLRGRTRDCLDSLFARGVPLEASVASAEGERREMYDLSPPLRQRADAGPSRAGTQVGDVYSLWAYAHHADRWEPVLQQLPRIEREFAEELAGPLALRSTPDLGEQVAELNAKIAGTIAYARLLERSGEVARAADARQRLAQLLTERVHFEVAEGRLQTRHGHRARIPRYEQLVPELSRLLGEFAGKALQRNACDLDRELPVWYQAWSERWIGGENYVSPPELSRGLFAVMADGLHLDASRLQGYLDQPWCRADLYYIEKLTALLRTGQHHCHPFDSTTR